MIWIVAVGIGLVIAIAIYDLTQRQHAILRTFPIIGHFRYWLEAVGPELRQYIVTDNNEERPFSRDQRRWIYASAKRQNNYFGFGSDNEMELQPSYLIIKHDTFPLETHHPGDPAFDPQFRIPCAKVMGGARGRTRAFRPASIVNVSGMSFGSLSGPAVEALNRGSQIAGCLQSTGEGGVSSHHLKGGDLVWQVGTGYFGCRERDGRFSLGKLKDTIARSPQIRAIEVKLSQGAKPGVGGLLPRAKITAEIAEIRGIPMDRDCISPAAHSAFRNADEMLDFLARMVEAGQIAGAGLDVFENEPAVNPQAAGERPRGGAAAHGLGDDGGPHRHGREGHHQHQDLPRRPQPARPRARGDVLRARSFLIEALRFDHGT